MRFDKLPSNWVNWRLQGRSHSLYATQSRVTGNAEANPTSVHLDDSQLTINGHIPGKKCTYGESGRICAIRTIHISRCHRWQFQSQLPSTRLDWVIYITEAARSSSSGYATIQLWLPNDNRYDYRYHWAINGGRVRDSGAAIADRVAAPKGKYNNPEYSKVASRYDSWLLSSIITASTWLDDRIGSLWGESHLRQLYSISSNKSTKAVCQRPTTDVPHTMAYEEGL